MDKSWIEAKEWKIRSIHDESSLIKQQRIYINSQPLPGEIFIDKNIDYNAQKNRMILNILEHINIAKRHGIEFIVKSDESGLLGDLTFAGITNEHMPQAISLIKEYLTKQENIKYNSLVKLG